MELIEQFENEWVFEDPTITPAIDDEFDVVQLDSGSTINNLYQKDFVNFVYSTPQLSTNRYL